MAFTVAFHPGAPLLLGGRRPVGAAAAATWHLPGPRASRRGQAPAHHRPAVRMATAPGGGGGDGDGASGDDVDATGARKPRGDPEWLDMAKQVGGRDGDGGGRKRGRSFWPFGGGKAAAKAEADDEEESRPAPKWAIPDGYGEEALGGGRRQSRPRGKSGRARWIGRRTRRHRRRATVRRRWTFGGLRPRRWCHPQRGRPRRAGSRLGRRSHRRRRCRRRRHHLHPHHRPLRLSTRDRAPRHRAAAWRTPPPRTTRPACGVWRGPSQERWRTCSSACRRR